MLLRNLFLGLIVGLLGSFGFADDGAKKWPYSVPCRVQDGENKDLFVMTLGDVETGLADGVFDPVKDEVVLKDGTVKANYYKDVLGVKYYEPLDKSIFPVPPSGWCTWYFYYHRITEGETMRNAKWIADNLKDYGAEYVQIDDGWQGDGTKDDKRDWAELNKYNFPSGMEALASYIKSLGLTPGIWIAPHGQTDAAYVKSQENVFLFKPDGTSASSTWEGKYLVDPTTKESEVYMKNLFKMMCDWGYEYFKIDGQPIVVDEYKKKKEFMQNPDDDNVKLYRKTLDDIREAIGPDRYLLGCWGMPVEGIGIMNGSRTAGDIVLGWKGGFMLALRATQRDYYLHNIAWYSDPDVFVLRSPLTMLQAQAWATLQGLTGLALMGTDRLEDLSADRVDMLRRIYPAVDIRPLDLFKVVRDKRIWDLKVNHLGRKYDILGLFNYDQEKRSTMYVKWNELDIEMEKPIHVFDFWNKEYLGAWENGMVVDIEPTSCRVLTLLPDNGKIQLISTNRHITQGWVDLKKANLNDATKTFTGVSTVVKDDVYELRFVYPKGKNFIVKSATAKRGLGRLDVKVTNHQGWSTVRFESKVNADVSWSVKFEKSTFYEFPMNGPGGLKVKKTGEGSVNLTWNENYWLNNGSRVHLDGELLGYTPRALFPISGLDETKEHTVTVESTWEDGTVSLKKGTLKFNLKDLEK